MFLSLKWPYIYIYIEREREREREMVVTGSLGIHMFSLIRWFVFPRWRKKWTLRR
jgi:hypothetical protein